MVAEQGVEDGVAVETVDLVGVEAGLWGCQEVVKYQGVVGVDGGRGQEVALFFTVDTKTVDFVTGELKYLSNTLIGIINNCIVKSIIALEILSSGVGSTCSYQIFYTAPVVDFAGFY